MRRQILYCIALIATSGALSDQLHLKNGSLIIGKLVSAAEDRVVFETPFAGNITIQQQNIERITTEEPVTLRMADGTVYENRQIMSTPESMLVMAEGEPDVVFKPGDIDMVNPEACNSVRATTGRRDDLRRI